MILECNIITNLEINGLMDLKKLKALEENDLKINKSRLAREMGCDRRTIDKYINGFVKSTSRNRKTQFDNYFEIIKNLLNDTYKIFEYKRILWQYLKDNYGLDAPESSFRRYISTIDEFQAYFDCKKSTSIKSPSIARFETENGKQAQLDWKESIEFVLKTGEIITINIFVLLLSYSRFRVYKLSLTKTQDVLFNYMEESFKAFGGVPHEILTDNMKTVMDTPRTEYSKGKVNNKFQQFADDYGFEVKPCIAGRPNTKAKVESPMRILDEIKAYSNDLTYYELILKLEEINNRENTKFHKAYSMIPVIGLEKEKDSLLPLPTEKIRNQYKITTKTVKVNKSSMITHKNNQYSVPPEYIDKLLQLQCYHDQIHLYYNMKLIAIHDLSSRKLNYLDIHYQEILKKTLPFDDEKIAEIAKLNLKAIGERYD